MKYKKFIYLSLIILIMIFIGGFIFYRMEFFNHVEIGENVIKLNNKDVYVYIPKSEKDEKLPMVFVLHGRNGKYENVVYGSGWDKVAEKEKFIIVAPNYNANGDTYNEIDNLMEVVKYAIDNFNVDETRVYVSGFSNGGASSLGLCQDYPEYFAAIAPMGWMKGMSNKDNNYEKYDMPFQIIKGNKEYTYETSSGKMAISNYEEAALKSLFMFNEMEEGNRNPNYDEVEYWGYKSHESNSIYENNKQWYIENFYKEGYNNPFGQLILIEDAGHRTNDYEATLAWDFLKNFARTEDGRIIEINNIEKENNMKRKLKLEINGEVLTATLEHNSSTKALVELLEKGSMTLKMNDYNNMEKVGSLGVNLPRNDENIKTNPGDIILYQGNSLAIYYDSNEWSLTKLGKIENIGNKKLKDILGKGEVEITMSII